MPFFRNQMFLEGIALGGICGIIIGSIIAFAIGERKVDLEAIGLQPKAAWYLDPVICLCLRRQTIRPDAAFGEWSYPA